MTAFESVSIIALRKPSGANNNNANNNADNGYDLHSVWACYGYTEAQRRANFFVQLRFVGLKSLHKQFTHISLTYLLTLEVKAVN